MWGGGESLAGAGDLAGDTTRTAPIGRGGVSFSVTTSSCKP